MAREVTAGQDDAVTNADGACAGRGTGTTWSVLGWFLAQDNSAGSAFARLYLERELSGNEYLTVGMNQSGAVDILYRPGGFGNPSATIVSAAGFDDAQWHRLLLVCRGDADYELYLDGLSEGTSSSTVTNTVTPDLVSVNKASAQSLPVGTRYARWMNFKTALTVAQAEAALYQSWPPSTPNLWWELGLASPEPDESGNGRLGTVLGGMAVAAHPPDLTRHLLVHNRRRRRI